MDFLKLNIQLFASATKSNTGLTSSGGNKATITASFSEATLTDDDISKNITRVTPKATFKMTSGSFSGISSPYLYIYWHDNKNNKDIEVAKKNVTAVSKGSSVSVSDTIEVAHKDDGTLNGYAYAKWVYTGNNQYTPKSGEVKTANTPLTTIPRASSVTATNADIGYSTTININKANNSFTTTLKYSVGNLSGTIVEKTALASYGWTVPTDIFALIPDDPYIDVTITAITYNGDKELGSKSTTFRATVNEADNKPDIEIKSVVDTNEKTIALTGDEQKLVKYWSNAKITLEKSAKNSATLSSNTINGVTFDIYSTEVIVNNVTSNKFTIAVTDSRKFPNSDTFEKSAEDFIDYVPLSVSASFDRNTPTDGKVVLKYSGNYFNGNFGVTDNILNMKYAYKLKDSDDDFSEWISITPEINDGQNTFDGELMLDGNFDYESAYTFKLSVSDLLTNTDDSNVYTQDVKQGIPGVWWNKSTFNINKDLYVKGSLILSYEIPIGSPFFTTVDKNPTEILGYGTWELYSQGRTIVGYSENDNDFNVVGKTGGSKYLQKHNHTFTTDDAGSHKHQLGGQTDSVSSGSDYARPRGYSSGVLETAYDTNEAGIHKHTGTTDNTGSGESGNLQPYIVMYIWMRTE